MQRCGTLMIAATFGTLLAASAWAQTPGSQTNQPPYGTAVEPGSAGAGMRFVRLCSRPECEQRTCQLSAVSQYAIS